MQTQRERERERERGREQQDDDNGNRNGEPLTYDEISMQQSRHFLDSLQELKNLRPQLYNAAEYCEYFYLNVEDKHMMLDSLKDYARKALVNAVDHLGSVTYKLDDLLNQQIEDISSTELRIACLNQRLRTCQEFNDVEGLVQQCLPEEIPRFHKHYVLPGSNVGDLESRVDNSEDVSPAADIRNRESKNASFRDQFEFFASSPKSQSFYFQDTEVPIPSMVPQSSGVQQSQLSPRLTSSTSFAAGRQASAKLSKSISMRLPSYDHNVGDVTRQPTSRSKSLFKFLLNKHKSMKNHT